MQASPRVPGLGIRILMLEAADSKKDSAEQLSSISVAPASIRWLFPRSRLRLAARLAETPTQTHLERQQILLAT